MDKIKKIKRIMKITTKILENKSKELKVINKCDLFFINDLYCRLSSAKAHSCKVISLINEMEV